MKNILRFSLVLVALVSCFVIGVKTTQAKSRVSGYARSSGVSVRSYTRYKADGYKFNNYVYRPDRGYKR